MPLFNKMEKKNRRIKLISLGLSAFGVFLSNITAIIARFKYQEITHGNGAFATIYMQCTFWDIKIYIILQVILVFF